MYFDRSFYWIFILCRSIGLLTTFFNQRIQTKGEIFQLIIFLLLQECFFSSCSTIIHTIAFWFCWGHDNKLHLTTMRFMRFKCISSNIFYIYIFTFEYDVYIRAITYYQFLTKYLSFISYRSCLCHMTDLLHLNHEQSYILLSGINSNWLIISKNL